MLFASGAPFEIAVEPVFGIECKTFANRMPNMRVALDQLCQRHGAIPNLVFPDITLTFEDLLASVKRVAKYFADNGVKKGDRIAFAAANIPEYVVGWWATVASGAIVSSLNGWWTPAELEYGIDLTDPILIFADGPRMKRLEETKVVSERNVHAFSDLRDLLGPPRADDPALPDCDISEDDPAVLLFTSGTTGRPKAATLSHRNLIHFPMAATLAGAIGAVLAPTPPPSSPPSQVSSIMVGPMFHISGVAPVMVSIYVGSKLVFPPVGAWSEVTHLQLTEEHKVGGWSAVPTQFWRLLEHPDFEKYDTSSVTTVGGGGAVYSPELFRLINRKMPQARIGVGYGMSETVGSGTRLGGVTIETNPASVGTIEAMCELQIRDENDNVVPEGEVGEICLRGAVVFLGYWNNPEATAKALDEKRWYRTGDYGRVENGVLYLESRMRDMIIRGGENIYPIEIEHRLEEHPEIAEVAVVGVPHHQLGQEVAAVVVVKPGAQLSPEDVTDWAAQALAKYKVPTHVLFRTELPYNATGKVLKHELEKDVVAELDNGN